MSLQQKIKTLHPLKSYTTIGVGGLARYFCEIDSAEDFLEVLNFASSKNLPVFVLGKGSNTLFVDEVFEAVVVLNRLNFASYNFPEVVCGSGYNISLLSTKSARAGFSGMEGAAGIPASVGGAIYMNAGAGAFETQQNLIWVKSIDFSGNVIFREKKDMTFSYRHSFFQENPELIIEAAFQLQPNKNAFQNQQQIIKKRILSQPYKDHSAGCFFKNPTGYSAGALIDQSGLKGLKFNDAEVSTLHANFLINKQNAQAVDILSLAQQVTDLVHEKTGIILEQEIRLVGNFMYEKI
jgi:UDP-N-acetylmuramate dehydrogenase